MTAARPPTAGMTTLLPALPLLFAAADVVLVLDLVEEAPVVAEAVEPEAVFAAVAETLEPEAVGVVLRVDEVVP